MNREIRTQIPQQTQNTITRVSGILQRKCACGTHTVLGGGCIECQKQRLQRRAANQAEPTQVPPIVHEVLRSPGQPLDPATRAFMEPRFGHDFSQVRVHTAELQVTTADLRVGPPVDRFEQEADRVAETVLRTGPSRTSIRSEPHPGVDFSQVRVHTDAQAGESARAVNARAYTVGHNIVFDAGQYAPETSAGRRLLAHELTHVLQQTFVSSQPNPNRVGDAETPGTTVQMSSGLYIARACYKGTCPTDSRCPAEPCDHGGTCKWVAGYCCCVGSLTKVLPGWLIFLLSAAAIALLVACFASGVCEAAAVAAAVGAALALVVIGFLRAAGVDVRGAPEETPTASGEAPTSSGESEMA